MIDIEQRFWWDLCLKINLSDALGIYCDWIEPKSYHLYDDKLVFIGATAFLLPDYINYKFSLTIKNVSVKVISEIDWKKLTLIQIDLLDLVNETVIIEMQNSK